jgi:phosphoribosylaminoimidazole carboxylase (NCAIR synthetase)
MTVEIEHVNTEILDVLAAEGKEVHPKPSTIRMIQVGHWPYFVCLSDNSVTV